VDWNLNQHLGPDVDSRRARRASCPTSLSDPEGRSSSRARVARKRSESPLLAFCRRLVRAHVLSSRKKKSKSKEALVGKEVIRSKALVDALVGEDKASKATQTQSEEHSPTPGTSTPTPGASSSSSKAKTDAEKRFEEIQRRRVCLVLHWITVNVPNAALVSR